MLRLDPTLPGSHSLFCQAKGGKDRQNPRTLATVLFFRTRTCRHEVASVRAFHTFPATHSIRRACFICLFLILPSSKPQYSVQGKNSDTISGTHSSFPLPSFLAGKATCQDSQQSLFLFAVMVWLSVEPSRETFFLTSLHRLLLTLSTSFLVLCSCIL